MKNRVSGLHHITAIAGNAQRNFEFYTKILGLRMVKKTVNFDDPGTYHFYFGNEAGTPGTILTFFPWEHVKKGKKGSGMATEKGNGYRNKVRRTIPFV
jgi:glyoxalase family protein